ncbi:hypothetical protein JOQ06_000679, partial [Pogonophryne albipinna]
MTSSTKPSFGSNGGHESVMSDESLSSQQTVDPGTEFMRMSGGWVVVRGGGGLGWFSMPPGVQVLDLNPETCGVSGRGSEGGFRVPGPVQLVGLQGIRECQEEKRPIDYTGLTFMILPTEEEKGEKKWQGGGRGEDTAGAGGIKTLEEEKATSG